MKCELTYEEYIKTMKEMSSKEDLSNFRKNCPITPVLVMLQGKWKNHILFEMSMHDSIRFGELKKALPEITNTMLTTTLRELECYGLIDRIQYNEIPPHVEYSLADKGRDLRPIYYEMFMWGMKHNS